MRHVGLRCAFRLSPRSLRPSSGTIVLFQVVLLTKMPLKALLVCLNTEQMVLMLEKRHLSRHIPKRMLPPEVLGAGPDRTRLPCEL